MAGAFPPRCRLMQCASALSRQIFCSNDDVLKQGRLEHRPNQTHPLPINEPPRGYLPIPNSTSSMPDGDLLCSAVRSLNLS